jgi:hypothetical protein
MQGADFDDFVQTVILVVLIAGHRTGPPDESLEVLIRRAIWSTYRAMGRDLNKQRRLTMELRSQAVAARPVNTEMPVEQQERLANVVSLAEATLSTTEILAITDRRSLLNEMKPGTIRGKVRRAIKKLRDAALAAGLCSLIIATSTVTGFFVGSRGGGLQTSSVRALRQSCRASERIEMKTIALARMQSCLALQFTEMNAMAQSCLASESTGIKTTGQRYRAPRQAEARTMSLARIQSCRATRRTFADIKSC